MDLSQVKAPDQYTLADYARANNLSLSSDEHGNPVLKNQDGDRFRLDDYALQDWAYKQYQNQLNLLGLVQLTEPGMQPGTILNGINDSVLQSSPTAQAYGLTNTGDYVNAQYGPGTSGTGLLGEQLYQGTSTDQQHPFDLGLGKTDLVSQILPGVILGMAGLPLAGALGGGALGGIGAGAIIGGGGSALMGGDPLKGALGGAVSGGLGAYLPTAGITDPALSGAIKGASSALVTGGDPLMGAGLGAASGAASSLLPSIPTSGLTFTASDGVPEPSGMDVSVNGYETDPVKLAANQAELDSFIKELGNQTMKQTLNLPFVLPVTQPAKETAGDKKVSFFGDLLGDPAYDPNVDTMDYSNAALQDWAMQNGVMNPDGTIDWAKFDQLDPYGLGAISGDYGAIPDGESAAGSGGLNLGGAAGTLIKYLLGSNGNTNSGLFGNGGILGTGLSLGNAAAIAPSIAAINYATKQSPFDTSSLQGLSGQIPTSFNFDQSGVQNVANQIPNFRVDTSGLTNIQNQVPTSYNFDTSKLMDAYNQFDPNSVTKQYDLSTAAAREGLASSLAARGVAGSSFANSDFANFGQSRDAGRQSLINDAITRRAGIANDILTNDRASASLGLQGLGLQGQLANQAINAQQQNNAQNLQGLGLRGQLAQSLLDNQYKSSALGLQGQGLQRSIYGDILNAQIASQKNKNDLYGRALLALSGGLTPKTAGIF